jgi:ribosomal protein L11 methylase PrmA
VLAIVDSLVSAIDRARWTPPRGVWTDYYAGTSYSAGARADKREIVARYVDRVAPRMIWDLGANTGELSRIGSERGIPTAAFDGDPAAVEVAYRGVQSRDDRSLLPLVMDLTNPSVGLGWRGRERMGLVERGPADLVLALALVHHLAIGHGLPLSEIAAFIAEIALHAVVEFVPKADPQVQYLLASRDDIFVDYTREAFEAAVSDHFAIEDVSVMRDSSRVLYLLRRRR